MKKQNITKTLTSLAALSLTAALMLTFPGCQASRTSGQPDTTPQDTTPRNTTPQDTEAPPTTEPEVTWKPVETTIDPGDLLTPHAYRNGAGSDHPPPPPPRPRSSGPTISPSPPWKI